MPDDTPTSTAGEEPVRTSDSGEISTVEMYPQFHLTYAIDWETSPQEVTIYPAGASDDRTRWITADQRSTVSLQELR